MKNSTLVIHFLFWTLGLLIGGLAGKLVFYYTKVRPAIEEYHKLDKFEDDYGLFFVETHRQNNSISSRILSDYVRKNSKKGEVVCREWKTGDYYIFSYPVIISDVTKTKDYIKYTNTK